MSRVRVLIVDDSRTMRDLLGAKLAADPDIEVVATAADPYEAREAIKAFSPDVVTLDVEMPRMDGLEFLEKLMRLRPTPVVMVSSLTRNGAATTIEALALGAVDYVGKPHFEHLASKVKLAARAQLRPRPIQRPARVAPAGPATADAGAAREAIIAIGASTGGVEALLEVLAAFPAHAPATLVVQHMPAAFMVSFAERLDRHCAMRVKLAEEGEALEPGCVYLAPGDRHLRVSGRQPRLRLGEDDPISGHRPSVDALFSSLAPYGARAVGVILTGMGADGAQGLLQMRRAGARTLGQDAQSCVIYGMPRVARELGGVECEAPLHELGRLILTNAARQRQGAV